MVKNRPSLLISKKAGKIHLPLRPLDINGPQPAITVMMSDGD